MSAPFFIGICGGSGSGKTYLLEALKQAFSEDCSVVSLDDYYKPKNEQEKDENGVVNFDLPTALDTNKLASDVQLLKKGESIKQSVYHFNVAKEAQFKIIEPSPIIIVEGLFVLEYPFVNDNLNFSIYIETDKKIQLERRLDRDLNERGYSQDEILYQWNNHVIPCYEKYLLPHKSSSSFVFKNSTEFNEELARLKVELENHIAIIS